MEFGERLLVLLKEIVSLRISSWAKAAALKELRNTPLNAMGDAGRCYLIPAW